MCIRDRAGTARINACGDSRLRGLGSRKPIGFRQWVVHRYSAMGGNRVSLNITLFQNGNGPVKLSAITSGGSQAMLFKINTFGESAFLDRLSEILD